MADLLHHLAINQDMARRGYRAGRYAEIIRQGKLRAQLKQAPDVRSTFTREKGGGYLHL